MQRSICALITVQKWSAEHWTRYTLNKRAAEVALVCSLTFPLASQLMCYSLRRYTDVFSLCWQFGIKERVEEEEIVGEDAVFIKMSLPPSAKQQ